MGVEPVRQGGAETEELNHAAMNAIDNQCMMSAFQIWPRKPNRCRSVQETSSVGKTSFGRVWTSSEAWWESSTGSWTR